MSNDRWLDGDAGPVVRPYTLTRGRTRLRNDGLDLISVLEATGVPVARRMRLDPEHRTLLALCRRPITFADLASEVDLPVGVVRVLVDDLREENLLRALRPTSTGDVPDELVLRKLLNGLRAL
ncbi:DUF742 domain-containing protein [Actinomadura verrucosospora]|uniref:Multi-component regulatory system-11 n=1 Tax=Actinomadura verrucosospora TaxID=46165 RepID=A0A7D4AT28_ACTVE|nr:DUF742 domain-containing protein [Actinomadura verrucosospora]QKG24329.1 multi-component regulatory system-11 [Actinomadura verrucosospora]